MRHINFFLVEIQNQKPWKQFRNLSIKFQFQPKKEEEEEEKGKREWERERNAYRRTEQYPKCVSFYQTEIRLETT